MTSERRKSTACRSGTAPCLTVELTGGSSKLTETYQLTVQGHALVEELKGTGSGLNHGGSSTMTTPVPIKRIFDKADAGG